MTHEHKNYTVDYIKSLFESEEINIKKNDFLFKSGDSNSYVYFNVSGKIKIAKKEVVVGFADEGEFVGITSCLCHKNSYFFSARACEESTLLKIQKSEFENSLKENPEFGKMMINILCQRLKWMESVYS